MKGERRGTLSRRWYRGGVQRDGARGEGRSEKSSAAYVGFRARLAAMVAATATATVVAAAAALIRVRRYEIIKLGLDGGEGDGMARECRRVGKRGCRERWMLEAMGRWMA